MKQLLCVLFYFSFTNLFGQSKVAPKYVNGYYIIQDSGKINNNDCIFCNPENMPDRIVLDSAKKMIARKTSNQLGYIYCEWKGKNYNRSYQEIKVWPLKSTIKNQFQDEGKTTPIEPYSEEDYWLQYYKGENDKKEQFVGVYTPEFIKIKYTKHKADSIVNYYKIPKASLYPETHLWTTVNYHRNGKIKSTGVIITGLNEDVNNKIKLPKAPLNKFKIGNWVYYNEYGKLTFKETILKPKKIN